MKSMEEDYKKIVYLLIHKMITGGDAELYIKMIENGYNIQFSVDDYGGNEIDIEVQFTKRYTKSKNKSKKKGFL
jgi:hypothetical protein